MRKMQKKHNEMRIEVAIYIAVIYIAMVYLASRKADDNNDNYKKYRLI